MANQLPCKHHPDRVANFECGKCYSQLCEGCAKHNWTPKGFEDQCPSCGIALTKYNIGTGSIPKQGVAGFIEQIPDFFTYLISPATLLMCFGLAIVTTPITYFAVSSGNYGIAVVLIFFVFALNTALYFHVISSASSQPSEFPSVDGDPMRHANSVLHYLLACLPLIAAMCWFGHRLGSIQLGVFLVIADPTIILKSSGPAFVYAIGILLLPLLTAIAAISKSPEAIVNPKIWLDNLRVFGATYWIASVAFYVVAVFEILVWSHVFGKIWTLPIPYLAPVAAMAVGYLPMVLRGRILAGLCQPYIDVE